jgi:hypothetical protein
MQRALHSWHFPAQTTGVMVTLPLMTEGAEAEKEEEVTPEAADRQSRQRN